MQEENLKEKSLKFSLYDGIFTNLMLGFTQDYFVPFLLLIGGTSWHAGILSAMPNLTGSLLQLKSADAADALKSRRRMINIFVFLQAFMLLPVIGFSLAGGVGIYIFIITVVIFVSCASFTAPAWYGLMADLVPGDKRGEYFGWRNKIMGVVLLLATFAGGFILQISKKNSPFYGFAVLFSLAFLSRMASWYFLTRMHEPMLVTKKEDYFSFFDFIKKIRRSNFARFVFFTAAVNFSVYLVSPFFSVLMLKDLSFGYMVYALIVIAAQLASFFALPRWGKAADKAGNAVVLKSSAFLISFIPLLWVINLNPVFLIFVQLFSGFIWCGFNLCALNFIYDAVTPAKRVRAVAYFNVINGSAIFLGSFIGGSIVDSLAPVFGYKILTLCLISFFVRLCASVFLPGNFKEVREVENIKPLRLFLTVAGVRPLNVL